MNVVMVRINTTPCREDLGLYDFTKFTALKAREGMKAVEEGIEKTAVAGDNLYFNRANSLIEQIPLNAPEKELVFDLVPKNRPEITFTPVPFGQFIDIRI